MLAPGRLGVLVGVGACLDDRGDTGPEAVEDAPAHRVAVAVLDRVVQQPGDRLLLITAVLQNERGDGEQVRDVGDLRALPGLRRVRLASERQRRVEGRADHHPATRNVSKPSGRLPQRGATITRGLPARGSSTAAGRRDQPPAMSVLHAPPVAGATRAELEYRSKPPVRGPRHGGRQRRTPSRRGGLESGRCLASHARHTLTGARTRRPQKR